jgi:hypothetical protein
MKYCTYHVTISTNRIAGLISIFVLFSPYRQKSQKPGRLLSNLPTTMTMTTTTTGRSWSGNVSEKIRTSTPASCRMSRGTKKKTGWGKNFDRFFLRQLQSGKWRWPLGQSVKSTYVEGAMAHVPFWLFFYPVWRNGIACFKKRKQLYEYKHLTLT